MNDPRLARVVFFCFVRGHFICIISFLVYFVRNNQPFMKRITFFIAFFILILTTLGLRAQHHQAVNKVFKQHTDHTIPNAVIIQQNHQTRGVGDSFPSTIGHKVVVGKTTYDLQTNEVLQDRILVQGNEIHATWTMSQETGVISTSAFADRGTGYNFFNGTAWGAPPTSRLENVRTGFGGIALNGNGNPIYMSHDFGAKQIILIEKTSGGWTNAVSTLTSNTGYWPHMATSGNWIYVMAGSDDSTKKTNGVTYGYYFSRSNDNGVTWIDNMIPLPLVDSVGHYYGGGNNAAISARDSIVVIVCGRIGTDLTMLRSSDYGATWTKKVIWDWPLDNFDFYSMNITDTNNDNIPDTLWTIDGSVDIAIDKAGQSHVAFPIYRVYKDGTTTGWNFYYRTLMSYYNSVMDSVKQVDDIYAWHHILCAGDSLIRSMPSYSLATPGDAKYRDGGTLTMPQVSVNENNNDVYITYTAIVNGDLTEINIAHPYWLGSSGIDGQPYRDVMVLASSDYGATFGYPVNITRTRHYEEVYPSVPERISGADLHFLYQGDIEPGNVLMNEDTYDSDFENWMIYQKVPIADIFTESATMSAPCNQFELPLNTQNITQAINGNINVYPNPATEQVTVEVALNEMAKKCQFELYDMTGRLLSTIQKSNVTNQKVIFNMKSYASGNYMLKISADYAVSMHKISLH